MNALLVLLAIAFVCTIACGAYIVAQVINHNFQELFKRLDKPAVMPQVIKEEPISHQVINPKEELCSKTDTIKKKEKDKTEMSFKEKEERGNMIKALNKHNGDMKKAAEHMRIPYPTFYNRTKKYKLEKYVNKLTPWGRRFSKITKEYFILRDSGKSSTESAAELKISAKTALKCEALYYNKLKYDTNPNC